MGTGGGSSPHVILEKLNIFRSKAVNGSGSDFGPVKGFRLENLGPGSD